MRICRLPRALAWRRCALLVLSALLPLAQDKIDKMQEADGKITIDELKQYLENQDPYEAPQDGDETNYDIRQKVLQDVILPMFRNWARHQNVDSHTRKEVENLLKTKQLLSKPSSQLGYAPMGTRRASAGSVVASRSHYGRSISPIISTDGSRNGGCRGDRAVSTRNLVVSETPG